MNEDEEIALKKGRFYKKVGTRFIPRAVAVWLENNPSFKEIPRGYVIHHLDYDELNDDISNLAMMYKTHHVAHHWKHINKKVTITIDSKIRGKYAPTKRPTVVYHPPAKRYYLSLGERSEETGKVEMIKVWRDYNNNPFFAKEDADRFADSLWISMSGDNFSA